MSSQAHHIRRLAAALTAGPMEDREALMARAKPLVGDLRKARWLVPLVRKLSLEFGEAPRPTVRRIAERIRAHEGFVNAWAEGRGRISIGHMTEGRDRRQSLDFKIPNLPPSHPQLIPSPSRRFFRRASASANRFVSLQLPLIEGYASQLLSRS